MGKNPKITVGYRYFLGVHFVVSHPIESLERIYVGEKLAWSRSSGAPALQPSGTIAIDKMNLMGGDKREGGVRGDVDVLMGEPQQTQNGYLLSQSAWSSSNLPAFRGIFSVVLKQVYLAANNAYIKPWSFLCRRVGVLSNKNRSTQWQPSLAAIGDYDINPIHIIRECLTNNEWGRGFEEGVIDENTFRDAAQTLFDESLGMSIMWNSTASIEDFIAEVLDTIDGILRDNFETGKIEIVLFRDDYNVNSLDFVDENIISELRSYKRNGLDTLPNQVVFLYTDRFTNEQRSITLHNDALISAQRGLLQLFARLHRYPVYPAD